jgi:hypothetical protein
MGVVNRGACVSGANGCEWCWYRGQAWTWDCSPDCQRLQVLITVPISGEITLKYGCKNTCGLIEWICSGYKGGGRNLCTVRTTVLVHVYRGTKWHKRDDGVLLVPLPPSGAKQVQDHR